MDGGGGREAQRHRRHQRGRDGRKHNSHRPRLWQLHRQPRRPPLHLHARPWEDYPSGDCPMTAQRFSADPSEFTNKRVLVTGRTKGMGQAIVKRLTAGGARVATTARSPLPDGQKVELFVQADVATPEGVEKVVGEVLNRLGGVDILVNCVGGSSSPSGGVLALSDEDWQGAINT